MNAQFSTIDGEKQTLRLKFLMTWDEGWGRSEKSDYGSENNEWIAEPFSTMLVSVKMMRVTAGRDTPTRVPAIVHQIRINQALYWIWSLGKVFAMTSESRPLLLPIDKWDWLSWKCQQGGIEHLSPSENGDWVDAYDMYGGQRSLSGFWCL